MFLLALSLTACAPVASPTGTDAAALQLEAGSASSEACPDVNACDGVDIAAGPLAVTRTAGDSSVDLTLTVADLAFDVHSPTGADLSAFDGADVTASIQGEWMVPVSLELRDDAGPVYVLEAGSGDVFSEVDVRYGAELGSIVDDADYELTFHSIDITTDDGVVSVNPGDVVTIHVNGATYRFGAIAAYTVGTVEGGEYTDCGGELPMLSYELVRIAADTTFPALKRPEGLPMALYSGCGG